jgi:hypothetical protein
VRARASVEVGKESTSPGPGARTSSVLRHRRCTCGRTRIRGTARRKTGCISQRARRAHTLLRSDGASECSARQRCLILPFRLIVPMFALPPHTHSPSHPHYSTPSSAYLMIPHRVPVPVPSTSTTFDDKKSIQKKIESYTSFFPC